MAASTDSTKLYVAKKGFWFEDGVADIAELGEGGAGRERAGSGSGGADGLSRGANVEGDAVAKLKRRAKRRSQSAGSGVYALENPNFDISWYSKYFVGSEHTNYVAADDAEYGNVVVSVLRVAEGHDPHYRVIVVTKHDNDRHLIPNPRNKKLSLKELLSAVRVGYGRLAKKLKKVGNLAMQKDLLKIEDMAAINKYKFGVLLVKHGQTAEADMFGNEDASPAFREFLECIGDRIELAGWTGYRAGLDTKYGNTGDTSYYTEIHGCQVMYHVSTCLPYTPGDGAEMTQQLQRKRHIGNDVVVIVFIDSEDEDTPFDTECISSQFNHVWAIVTPTNRGSRQTQYKVAVAANDSVRYFMPMLPSPPVFTKGPAFREWLLTKMINGERSAMDSKAFVQLSERTKELMLGDIVSTYMGARVTDHAKEQAIRKQIEAMVTSSSRGRPKHTISIFDSVTLGAPYAGQINALGFYGDAVVYGTDDALLLRAAASDITLSDAGPVYALAVIADVSVAVAIQGKRRTVAFYPLAAAASGVQVQGTPLTAPGLKKATILAYGTYSTTPLLAVASGSSVFVFQWSGSSFALTQSHTLPAHIAVLTFFKSFLVVGFGHSFEVIDLETSAISPLRASPDALSPVAVCVVDAQLMLVFADEGVFVNVNGDETQEFALKWTTLPTATCFMDPYIISFTRNFAEVRTKVTGRLVQTMQIPDCTFHGVRIGTHAHPVAYVSSYDPTRNETSLLGLQLASHSSVAPGLAVVSESIASILASAATLPVAYDPAYHRQADTAAPDNGSFPADHPSVTGVSFPPRPTPLAPAMPAARAAALAATAASSSSAATTASSSSAPSGLELDPTMAPADVEWVTALQNALLPLAPV